MKFFKLFDKSKKREPIRLSPKENPKRYGFIKPNGEYVYGEPGRFHNDIAVKYGFGKGIYKTADDAATALDDKARDAAIKAGWVRFRFHLKGNASVLEITLTPNNNKAKTNALKLLDNNRNMGKYFINEFQFPNYNKAVFFINDRFD